MGNFKTIAICYTQDEKPKVVCEIKNVSIDDYEKLLRDTQDYELEKERVILLLKEKVEYLESKLDELQKEINLLKGID